MGIRISSSGAEGVRGRLGGRDRIDSDCVMV